MSGMTIAEYAEKRGIDHASVEKAKAELRAKVEAFELKEARARRGLTQSQLAKNMGISQKRISELENGRTASLKIGTLDRYASGLGGTLHVIIEFPGLSREDDATVTEIPIEA